MDRTRALLRRTHLLGLLVLAACGSVQRHATKQFEGKQLYLTCNVRAEHGSIHDGLYYDSDLLAVGSPVTIGQRALMGPQHPEPESDPFAPQRWGPVLILGEQRYTLRHTYGRKHETATEFVAKLVSETDPTPRLLTFPPEVQQAIREAKVRKGMTREQVIMALCPPPIHATPSQQATSWTYWRSSFDRFYVVFGDDGTVTALSGTNPPEAD